MPRFRLRADHPVDVYRPAGHADSLRVEPGQVVEAPGEVVTKNAPEDAHLVDSGGELRAWPKSMWELEDKPAAKAAAVKEG